MAELHGHGLGVDGCVEDPLPAAVPGVDGGGGHQVVGVGALECGPADLSQSSLAAVAA